MTEFAGPEKIDIDPLKVGMILDFDPRKSEVVEMTPTPFGNQFFWRTAEKGGYLKHA